MSVSPRETNYDQQLLKATSWVKDHPRAFNNILEECNNKLNEHASKIYLVDVIATLCWHKKIRVSVTSADMLAVYLVNNFPIFEGVLTGSKKEDSGNSFKRYMDFIKFSHYMDMQ